MHGLQSSARFPARLDMGGIAAGSYGATATEVFQEGLRIPPVKLVKRGVLNEEVLALMRQNVRRPDMLWGDLQAARLVGHGRERHAQARGALRQRDHRPGLRANPQFLGARHAGDDRAQPDGRYEFEDFIDDDGLVDEPIRIHARDRDPGEEIDASTCRAPARRRSGRSTRRSPLPAPPCPTRSWLALTSRSRRTPAATGPSR